MQQTTDCVAVSRDVARAALWEVQAAIRRTGGGDADDAVTPLALARQRIEADDSLADGATERVLEHLYDVGDERGVEVSDADPLVDATFIAERELSKALDGDGGDEVGEPLQRLRDDKDQKRNDWCPYCEKWVCVIENHLEYYHE